MTAAAWVLVTIYVLGGLYHGWRIEQIMHRIFSNPRRYPRLNKSFRIVSWDGVILAKKFPGVVGGLVFIVWPILPLMRAKKILLRARAAIPRLRITQ